MDDLISQLPAAIADNAALVSWAQANLGQRFNLFVGTDDNNPPGEDKYPLVAITEIRINGAGVSPRVTYEVDVAAGVKNEAEPYDEERQVYIYQGLIQSEEFRARLFTALYQGGFGKISIKDGAVGQIASHPLYISGMTVEIEYINKIRRT